MSIFSTTSAVAIAALVFSATAAFAQAGGPDVPSDAKAKGTMENGSSTTGMSKGEAMQNGGSGSMMKSGSMKSGSMMKAPTAGGSATATGGASGGHPGQM